ncbi:venom dipeptidyl peptidase 4 [Trichonephila clavipes]|nr:venom dipeptidyl peptidase 4 [Trichonephila clavipes]
MESAMPRTEECLTCDLGEECTYHNAIFSPGAKYYILECLGPGVPWIDLRNTDNHTRLDLLDSNDNVRYKIENTAMPQLRTFNVPIEGGYSKSKVLSPTATADTLELPKTAYDCMVEVVRAVLKNVENSARENQDRDANVRLLLPPGLRDEEMVKYPMVINV